MKHITTRWAAAGPPRADRAGGRARAPHARLFGALFVVIHHAASGTSETGTTLVIRSMKIVHVAAGATEVRARP